LKSNACVIAWSLNATDGDDRFKLFTPPFAAPYALLLRRRLVRNLPKFHPWSGRRAFL